MVDRVDVGEYRRVTENGRLLTGDYLPVLHETSLRHSLDLPITIQRLAGYSQGLSLRYNR